MPSTSSLPACVIYVRVSSKKQLLEGDGLRGQETRCREYATEKGYQVLKVFYERGLSGDVIDRVAMADLLAFLDQQPGETIVIIEDIKRWAREVELHFGLKSAIIQKGGRLESPLFRFEDTPEGKFFETIGAAQAELERTQNKRQVMNRTRARLMQGFWTFRLPSGLIYAKDRMYNKVVVHEPVQAPLIKEALERFARGSFSSQMDMVRFLEAREFYGTHPPNYSNKVEQVKSILTNILYTGYLEYRPWDITLRKGHHAALIDLTTYQAIQAKLKGRERTFARIDVREEFPLRNFVSCASCGRVMTASWSKGRSKHYPYYHCQERKCSEYGRTISKATIELAFEELMSRISVGEGMLRIVRAKVLEVWEHHVDEDAIMRAKSKSDLAHIDADLRNLADKLARSKSEVVIATLESRIEELSNQRLGLLAASEAPTEIPDVGTAFDHVKSLLKDPLHFWKTGNLTRRRLLVRLTFQGALTYDRKAGFGTTQLSLPYLVSGHFVHATSGLVDLDRETWNQVLAYMLEWYKLFVDLENGTLDKEYIMGKRLSRRKYPYRRKEGVLIGSLDPQESAVTG